MIRNPFPDDDTYSPSDRLKDAVKQLNKGNELLRFQSDAGGGQVKCEPKP